MEIANFICRWVLRTNNIQISENDDLFLAGGLDSLNFVELISDLEMEFNIVVSFDDLLDWNSIRTPFNLQQYINL